MEANILKKLRSGRVAWRDCVGNSKYSLGTNCSFAARGRTSR